MFGESIDFFSYLVLGLLRDVKELSDKNERGKNGKQRKRTTDV